MSTSEIQHPAAFTAHWPSGPVHCCVKHARALQHLGRMLGAHIAITAAPDDAQCVNCINEANTDARQETPNAR